MYATPVFGPTYFWQTNGCTRISTGYDAAYRYIYIDTSIFHMFTTTCDLRFFFHRNMTIAMTQTPSSIVRDRSTQSNRIWTETVGKFGVVFSSNLFRNIFKITNYYIRVLIVALFSDHPQVKHVCTSQPREITLIFWSICVVLVPTSMLE